MLEEAERRPQVKQEPAEPTVVEVDHLYVRAIDQQVGQPHVGVDEPEPLRPGAEASQPLADQRGGPAEHRCFLCTNPDAVLPAPPPRRRAYAAVEVPAKSVEPGRPLPAAGVPVHSGADPAEQLELPLELIGSWLAAWQELKQHALPGALPDLDVDDLPAIDGAKHRGGEQPLVPAQRL